MKVFVNANYTGLNDKIYILFLSTQKLTRHCMTFPFSHVFFGQEETQVKSWCKRKWNFFDYTVAILGNWESNPQLWPGGAPNWQRYMNLFFLLISLSPKKGLIDPNSCCFFKGSGNWISSFIARLWIMWNE